MDYALRETSAMRLDPKAPNDGIRAINLRATQIRNDKACVLAAYEQDIQPNGRLSMLNSVGRHKRDWPGMKYFYFILFT